MSKKQELQEELDALNFTPRSHNEHILTLLTTCPESQAATHLIEQAKQKIEEIKQGNVTPEQLRDFLVEDFYFGCCGTGPFVKALCDPKFIKSEDYMKIREDN